MKWLFPTVLAFYCFGVLLDLVSTDLAFRLIPGTREGNAYAYTSPLFLLVVNLAIPLFGLFTYLFLQWTGRYKPVVFFWGSYALVGIFFGLSVFRFQTVISNLRFLV